MSDHENIGSQKTREASMRGILIGLLAGLIFLLTIPLTAKQALAIPAFARKYNLPCSVCHVPAFPKLNDFGNQFRDHGYQLGGDTDLPTNDALTNGYWPVSFRTTVGYQAASLTKVPNGTGGTTSISSGDFGFTGLDILAFGTLARDISFGVVLTPGLGSAGFGSGNSLEDSDLEAAFLRVDNVIASDYLVNLRVGKYELDLPFSEKRSPTINTPFVMYHYQAGHPYTTALGDGLSPQGYSNPNDFGIGDNHPGLELAGIKATPGDGFFRYSLNALSNSDVNVDGTGGGHKINFYGHVTQSIGGYGIVTGQRVGLFGAYGDAPTVPNSACTSPSRTDCGAIAKDGEPFYRAGVDLSLTAMNQLNIFGAYMKAKDNSHLFSSQPIPIPGARDAEWNGAFVEVDYSPTQLAKWLFSYRYDMVQNTKQADPTVSKSFNDVSSHTLLARYNFNITNRVDTTLHLEYNMFTTKKTSPEGGDQTGQTTLVAFDFAF
jgi:hypothetical protein